MLITYSDDPYAGTIRSFLVSEFPKLAATKGDALEAVSSILIGTNNTRYGPVPPPETLVSVRAIVRDSIEKGAPIPVLIPWGGRKTDPTSSIDIAEVMSLRVMEALHRRVQEFHPAGLTINVRLEDLGAWYIYANEGGASRASSIAYTEDFQKLAFVLGLTKFIHPIAESSLMDERAYFDRSNVIAATIYGYLMSSEGRPAEEWSKLVQYEALVGHGWKGLIPREQRDYYLNRYARLYPGDGREKNTARLADYLAGSLVRYQMGGSAAPAKESILISFVPPVPGAPDRPGTPRLYYRTLPASAARTHIPAWRGKGYLKIGEGTITPKICAFHDVPENIHRQSVLLESDCGLVKVKVATDYAI